MIDKLAVILAGEYRTWPKAYQYLFNFFKPQATQIDYYFVTWQLNQGTIITDADIVNYFEKENLVSYKIVDDIKQKHTYYRHNYLVKIGNILKKEQEFVNNFIYDQVVVTRPDFYFRKSQIEWEHCPDLFYQIDPIIVREFACQSAAPENYYPWIHDVYIRCSSATDDILSQKYFMGYNKFFSNTAKLVTFPIITGHHYLLSKFLMTRNLLPLSFKLINEDKPNALRKDYTFDLAIRNYHQIEPVNLDDLTQNQITTLLYRR